MENLEEKIRKPQAWHTIDIKGKWKLVYRVGNSQGSSAFGGYHLGTYSNPFNGQKTFLRNVDNQALQGIMIDKIVRILKPEENENEKLLISWLLCHPEVAVSGVPDLDAKILAKKVTGKLTLTYTDYEEVGRLEQEDYIDKLVGLLSLDGGTKAISLTKLRYIMAHLNLTYRVPRFDSETEKKSLRSMLKAYARNSMSNAKAVNQAIKHIDMAQDTYEFKEMVRLKVIEFVSGVYRFNNTPIGGSQEAVTNFFDSHPEVKTEILTLLYKQLT